MATPIIQLDGSVSGAGTPGDSRDDFVAPEVITVIDTANPAPTTFSVILRARPVGSAAVISAGPGANQAQFTMDVDGTYLVEVIADGTNSGVLAVLGGQDFFFSGQGGAASKLPNGFRPIAAGETIQFGSDGWAPATNAVIAAAISAATQANIPTTNQKTDLGQLDGAAEGSIWYADATGRVTRLAPGAANQQLITQGAGLPPLWITPAGVVVSVRNETGGTLSRGDAVTVTGFSVPEDMSLISLADKDDAALRPAVGLLLADLPNNTNGSALVAGALSGLDTSAFALSDQLVLGNAGALIRPPPETTPFTGEMQNIGWVAKVGAADGDIFLVIDGLALQFQRAFVEVTADTTTVSAVFVDLFSTTITKSGLTLLDCFFSVAVSTLTATAQEIDFRLVVDGVVKRATSVSTSGAGNVESAALIFRALAVPAGARIVKIQWRTTGDTAQVRPVAAADSEHASLLVQEAAI